MTNWAGPPAGKLVNWFLDNDMVTRFSKALRRPSGKFEIMLFSTLNCSRLVQLARELGIEFVDNRLYLTQNENENTFAKLCKALLYYLKPILVNCVKLPMVSGKLVNLLCCKSKVVNWTHFPISGGICSNWL